MLTMSRLISRAELARIAGVSRPAITKACKKQLLPAMSADQVDLDHPAVAEYFATRGVAVPEKPKSTPRAPTKAKPRAPGPSSPPRAPRVAHDTAPAPPPPPSLSTSRHRRRTEVSIEHDDEFERFAEYTLRQLVEQFGTGARFVDWLSALNKLEATRGKKLENDETEGHLISRQLVETHVFGFLDGTNRRLLRDTPKTVARRLYAAAKSGTPIEESERVVHDILSKQLKSVKDKVARALSKPKGK